ncbi:MAG TPA: phosphoribosyltransferase family protein [Coriobacteriia bacterium]
MVAELRIGRHLAGPVVLFANRAEAGRVLAGWIDPHLDPDAIVFALPRGGVPVGRPLADAMGCELLPALVRKLPIPTDPEMGFGAVAVDGTVRLNEAVVEAFGISRDQIPGIVDEVRAELERRSAVYPGGWPLPSLAGRHLWLVDDGLATGLSMLTAADMLRAQGPASLTIAVPCSPSDSLARVSGAADALWCLAAQDAHPFAVASFYHDFHDLDDAEVREALQSVRQDPRP